MDKLTEAQIRQHCTWKVFERGQAYFRNGYVLAVTQQGNRLTASVQGSEYQPYSVRIAWDAKGQLQWAECSCPYEGGGLCKHVVAALLAAKVGAKGASSAPEAQDWLARLTDEQLRRTVAALLQAEPGFAAAFARHAAVRLPPAAHAAPATKPTPNSSVDSPLARTREQLRLSLTGLFEQAADYRTKNYRSGRGWHFPPDYLKPQVAQADQLLAQGNTSAALDLVTMVLDEWIVFINDYADELSDDNFTELSDISYGLLRPLADGLLRQELSPAARADWQQRIEAWEYELGPMEVAKAAALYGWDHPPLVVALRGNWSGMPLWQLSHPSFDAELADLYLDQLRRQQRTAELLNLARAVGKAKAYVGYADELADAGKAEEAVAAARELFDSPSQALQLAHKLHEQQATDAALRIAAWGLALEDWRDKPQLAKWTAEVAEASGEFELALKATVFLFASSPTLSHYRDAERLSGSDWPEIKIGLLELLENSSTTTGRMGIYQDDQLVEEAMAWAEREPDAVEMADVVTLAAATHPDWCIRQCRLQAEAIIAQGVAGLYPEAADWLAWAYAFYRKQNRLPEWNAYLEELIAANHRRYRLLPLLQAIGQE